jgi:ABC-type Fe3+ transport system permease subunit
MASVRNVTIGLFLTETNTQVLGPTVISFFQQESINNTAALVMIQVLIIALAVVLLQVASRRRVEL